MALADAFDLVGDGASGSLGAVLVHGFTGTPYEMRFLGESLARAGITALGVKLPGHGTTVEELAHTTWPQWAGAVDGALDQLKNRCDRVCVIGQSLGGLLALHAAAHRTDLAAVATLAAPLWLEGLSGRFARWAANGGLRWLDSIPKLYGSDVRDRRVARENPSYRAVPTRGLAELARFMAVVEAELPRVTQPLLVLHGAHDHTAPAACAARIAQRVGSRDVKTRVLARSYHLLAADVERDLVAADVIDFLRRHAAAASSTTGDLACAT